MFEQAFKNIDDVLHKDAGCSSELDYVEQTSWLLFLKYLDDLEETRRMEAALEGKLFDPIIDEDYRWSFWAAPKDASGAFDHNNALVGPDLVEYVNGELIPYLKGFKGRAESPDTIDTLQFRSQQQKHELSALYEEKIKRMGNAGRNGGEYYTPRPLIRAMVKATAPAIGERIYDPACGSAGFLCEAHDYLRAADLKRVVAVVAPLVEAAWLQTARPAEQRCQATQLDGARTACKPRHHATTPPPSSLRHWHTYALRISGARERR